MRWVNSLYLSEDGPDKLKLLRRLLLRHSYDQGLSEYQRRIIQRILQDIDDFAAGKTKWFGAN